MGDFRPEDVLAALERHGVRYVLIGGLAAALYGSDLVTADVDITPAVGAENLAALSAALRDLEAQVRIDGEPVGLPFDHDGESLLRGMVWNLTTRAGDLDVTFVPAGTSGYDDLRRDAIEIEVLGVRTTIAALADVIRSKEAAGRPKDRLALPVLRRLLDEEDPPAP